MTLPSYLWPTSQVGRSRLGTDTTLLAPAARHRPLRDALSAPGMHCSATASHRGRDRRASAAASPSASPRRPNAASVASIGAIASGSVRALGGLTGTLAGTAAGGAVVLRVQQHLARSSVQPKLDEVPQSPEFDALWLTGALRRSGVLPLEAAVREMRVGEIKLENTGGDDILNGGGFAGGRTVRIDGIVYDHGAENNRGESSAGTAGDGAAAARATAPRSSLERLPRALIQKWTSSADGIMKDLSDYVGGNALVEFATRSGFAVLQLGLGSGRQNVLIDRELFVYREILPQLSEAVGVRTPAVFYSGLDTTATAATVFSRTIQGSDYCRAVLLLEDLGEAGYIPYGNVSLDMDAPFPIGGAEAALRSMARIHAYGWGAPSRHGGDSLSMPPSMLLNIVAGFHPASLAVLTRLAFGWSHQVRKIIDLAWLWPEGQGTWFLRRPAVAGMLYDLRANVSRWAARAAKFSDRQTIVHGAEMSSFLCHFVLKLDHLPRQARHKHRKG